MASLRRSYQALVVLLALPLCTACAANAPRNRPDAGYYNPVDAPSHPWFRDAPGCGGNTSGTSGGSHASGTSGTSGQGCGHDAAQAEVDAAPACQSYTFTYVNADATSVWVTGDFTAWATTPPGALVLTNDGSGNWSLTTHLGAGKFLYKYIVDGTSWIVDPTNPNTEPDGYGAQNSVLQLCGDAGAE